MEYYPSAAAVYAPLQRPKDLKGRYNTRQNNFFLHRNAAVPARASSQDILGIGSDGGPGGQTRAWMRAIKIFDDLVDRHDRHDNAGCVRGRTSADFRRIRGATTC
eukprot:6208757-Pleurochrysis_carterae.AAC.3